MCSTKKIYQKIMKFCIAENLCFMHDVARNFAAILCDINSKVEKNVGKKIEFFKFNPLSGIYIFHVIHTYI